MMNDFSMDSVNSQSTSLLKNLSRAKWTNLAESELGYIFTDDHLASNWNNIYVHPEVLSKGEAQKGMRKITSPVLLLKSHSSKMAYIMASENSPVFVCAPFKRSKSDGYTMLFTLKPHVCAEYLFYMSKYKKWTSISYGIDSFEELGDGPNFSEVGVCGFDGYREFIMHAETIFLNGVDLLIPSMPVQRQQIEEAKIMEQVILDKMSEKERKFQQKEWLNEAHIRNSKHRLSNDVMPVRMSVERLERFITSSTDGVNLSSIIGKATNQTVGDLLKRLIGSIQKIEDDIEMLTKSETAGTQPETIEVEKFIREYSDGFASSYNRHFTVNIKAMDNDLKIRIPHNSFVELLDNIFSNAVRHGFTDEKREDYEICVILSETNDGYCKIDIANNGNPISERGRKEYFVRGSFAGETGNTGLGGARVFEICEDANGKVVEPYSTKDFPVVISVEFPIVSR